ncbi:type II toxin-antitoxin system Phd/YefM family antitoxin [Bradyrhizobium ganzhouense]|uniref:type II toxin-antitoxin system Phd/YefM family antitoxin n=1 Tax=Bradyrhizobium ganzhouense TaxID=1179767 RepID=UPI003CF50DB2
MREVRLHDARANLSAIVNDAIDGKPVVIMRRGKKQAVVLGSDEWLRLSQVPGFGRAFQCIVRECGGLAGSPPSKVEQNKF